MNESRLAVLGGDRHVPKDRKPMRWPIVDEASTRAVQTVLESGSFTAAAAGESALSGLEEDWAARVGTARCVAVSNGTAALSLALEAAGVRPGDDVVVPALSFVASASAPVHVGARPVFADIDPVTFNMTPATLRAAVTAKTTAVVIVHLHGLPADLDELLAVARDHDLLVVEDAAQAHGARYHDRPVGSFGDVGTFSLNVSKNLPTCGEGGLVTTDDPDIADRVTMLRQFGEDIPTRGARSYISHAAGWNHKPNAIQAAFTRAQLARFDDDSRRRHDNVTGFLQRLDRLPGLVVPSELPDRTHVWHILRFTVDPAAWGETPAFAARARAAVERALRSEGVPVGPYQMMPLPWQAAFEAHGGADAVVPRCAEVIERSFAIQKAHLHPEAGPLLECYAEAFEKVWVELDHVLRYARDMAYEPPWAKAAKASSDRARTLFAAPTTEGAGSDERHAS